MQPFCRSCRFILGSSTLAVVFVTAVLVNTPAFGGPLPEVERIKRSPVHHHAIGCGDNPENALSAAVSALAQSVRVHVITSTRSQVEEQRNEITSQFERTVRTTSSMPIHGLRSMTWRDGNRHCAIAYVRNDSLIASFERSKTQMLRLIHDADLARNAGRLGDALRSLFWAYLLAGSLLETSPITVPGTNLTEPSTALPAALRSIAEGLSIRAGRPGREGRLITVPLHAEFEGRPVQQLDFRYYRGHGQEYGSFRRGQPEVIELDFEITNLVLNLIHVYRGDLARNPDLYAAYQSMGEPELDLYVTIPVRYPWKDTPPSPPDTILPQPILGLLACEDGATFIRTLEIYRRNGRLIAGRSQADVQHLSPRVFLALVDPDDEQPRPILLATTADGYRCLRTQSHHTHLSEFRGRRLIYLGVPELP